MTLGIWKVRGIIIQKPRGLGRRPPSLRVFMLIQMNKDSIHFHKRRKTNVKNKRPKNNKLDLKNMVILLIFRLIIITCYKVWTPNQLKRQGVSRIQQYRLTIQYKYTTTEMNKHSLKKWRQISEIRWIIIR